MGMERLPFCFPLDLKGIVNSHSQAGKSWNSWRGLAKSKEGGKKALEKGHKTSLSFLQFPGNTRQLGAYSCQFMEAQFRPLGLEVYLIVQMHNFNVYDVIWNVSKFRFCRQTVEYWETGLDNYTNYFICCHLRDFIFYIQIEVLYFIVAQIVARTIVDCCISWMWLVSGLILASDLTHPGRFC